MSAVIWFGIVAVWAFVLIPTWVRRSDIHWRRSGDATSARHKLGRAARVIRSGGRRTASARATVPAMRRPVSAATRRTTVAAASTAAGRTTSLVKGSVEELSLTDAQTETLSAVVVDEPPTRHIPAVGRRSSRRADKLDDAADFAAEVPASDAEYPAATETVSSAQVADAAEPEAPLTTPRSPRPVPRRAAPGHGNAPVPPHVQRARRLVWIAAAALATLLLAFVFRGWWILLNLVADLALFAYLRYLRGIAKQQLTRKARAQTARAESRTTGPRGPERAAPVRPQQRRSVPRHRADSPSTARTAPPQQTAARAASTAPATARNTVAAPAVIDLTDDALSDDCPTTELTVARAV